MSKNKYRFSPVACGGTGLNNQAFCLFENLERAEIKLCPCAERNAPANWHVERPLWLFSLLRSFAGLKQSGGNMRDF